MKALSTLLFSALLISFLTTSVTSQKRRSPSARPRATQPSTASTTHSTVLADAFVEKLPPKYTGDNAGSVYQKLEAISFRLRKSQFETTPDYEARIRQMLSAIRVGGKTVDDRFSFVHPYGAESYDADSQIFTLKADTNFESGLGYDLPELPNDIRAGRDYSSIDLTRTSRTVGSRIGKTAIGVRKRITVRAYTAVRLVMPNRSLKGWSDGLTFRVAPAAAREASGRVWLAVTGRLAPPYVLHDSDVDNATLSDPEEAHSFNYYLFFVPDSIVLYNVASGQIYAAWDLTRSFPSVGQPGEGPMRRPPLNSIQSANTNPAVRAPRVLSQPTPIYTEEARHNQITGNVVLSALFTENGEVTEIQVVKGLPDGLTERAIEAAKKITFVPAELNGKKVPYRITLEYNFNLY